MKKFIVLFAILLLLVVVNANSFMRQVGPEKYQELLQKVAQNYPQVDEKDRDIFLLALAKHSDWMANQTFYEQEPGNIVPFKCTTFSRSQVKAPTTVHDINPCYIDVVAAIGDSITAGFGAKAKSIFTAFTEYRGVSWSIGGDNTLPRGTLTVPNLLREYNPNLRGYAIGSGGATSSNAKFDQAVSGAIAKDMLGQAQTLLALMKKEEGESFETAYKMITIFIGGNDLCAACKNYTFYSRENYKSNLVAAIDFIHDQFPNTIVNLVPSIDVTELKDANGGLCLFLHAFECSCGTADRPNVIEEIRNLQKEYVTAALEIANEQEYDPNFAVISQPFMANTFVPRNPDGSIDMAYFAPDCFHFSELAHQAASVALWNNINQKVGSKENFWEGPKEQILCPTTEDFVWTRWNSQ